VVVALAAIDGEAEERFAQGVHAIDERLDAKLFGLDAAFLIEHGVAEEASGDALIPGGAGQEIAGELFDGELIEGHVFVEGIDDPIAVRPDGTGFVLFVAVAVGVTGDVEPMAGPALAVMGRSEEAFDELFVGVRPFVSDKIVHLLDGGREAGEVEAESANQSDAVGFGGWFEAFFFEASEDEVIDGIEGPVFRFAERRDVRDFRPDGRFEGPVVAFVFDFDGSAIGPIGALIDPGAEEADLVCGEALAFFGHDEIFLHARDGMDQQALGTFAGENRGAEFAALKSDLFVIETELGFLLFGSVATVAVLGEDWLDVFYEINVAFFGRWDVSELFARDLGFGRVAQRQFGRPFCTLIDPGAKDGDLVFGERLAFAGWGHFGILDEASGEMDERTFAAVAGEDVGAVFAAFESVFAGVEKEFAFGFLGIVAGEAGFFEDGLNVFGEIDLGRGGWREFGGVHCRCSG